MNISLVKTKLNIPPKRPNLVPRPRLMTTLDEALFQQQRLILVSAKAGSGKTTLTSAWLHQQEQPAAWLALDDNDNDPRRFCGYLVAALQRVELAISTAVSNQLEMEQMPQVEGFMRDLVNELVGQVIPCLLVLDDFHLIQNEWIQRAIAFFIEHQPPEITLILVTRVDPPLPLARLRGRGQVSEIRDEDLKFTLEESLQYLNEVMKLGLTSGTVAELETQTEGWIVGLQMAAISMHGRKEAGDLRAFIDAFSGTNRYILDYLMEEVLDQQSPLVQDFLLETSILERMCGPLCDAVQSEEGLAKRVGSQTVLSQLERTNLFVVPLDNERRWYRYHHLFADLLNSTLRQQRTAEEIRELHHRASLWHHGENQLEEAMIHAMAAQDYERAAAMIDENIVTMLSRSEAPVLLNWIEKLPPEIAVRRPWVDVYRAYTLALSGRSDEAERVIDNVEKRINPTMPRYSELLGEIAAIRAFTANMHGDAARVIQMASLAEEKLPDEHFNARGMTAYALADTYFARDDMERSSQESLKMLEIGKKLGRLLMSVTALCDLAATRKAQGRLHQAHELYNRAYGLMAERNSLDSRVRCPYEVGMADLLFQWNQLDAAYEHAQTGILYGQRFRVPSLRTSGNITLMRIFRVWGDFENALKTLNDTERFIQTHPLQLATRIEFNKARVEFWLAAGDLQAANRWAKTCNGGSELEQIVLARLLVAQGDVDDAREILDRQRALAEAGNREGRLIEILSLQALIHMAEGNFDDASAALALALSLAQPEGTMRLFLDMGRPFNELLQRSLTGKMGIAMGYEQDILNSLQQERNMQQSTAEKVLDLGKKPGSPLQSPLTERELDVLKLLAEGISNKEIAGRLVVAPSTVKQHLKNIYSKLDVHSRVQAVERGRELGLI